MENIITFDLEYWYDSEFVLEKSSKDLILEGLQIILPLLKKHGVSATFFVTGNVLEKYPEAIKRLLNEGHEIASHGYNHKMISKLSKKEAKREIKQSRNLIKKVIKKSPIGFRAPSWSISKKDFWIYDFLKENDFVYSSSLFPINVGLYGNSKFPTKIFKPNKGITEIPITPFKFFKLRIPFSGGIYFRIWPQKLLSYFIKELNKDGKRVILYLHPWEFCSKIPKIKTTLIGKITTYYGLKGNIKKLDKILSEFKFNKIEEVIQNEL